ncbi:titin homolog [Zophobas morio]|uniref:titin homolog n=1 Tax=Zophobas morio TaxID=2755281 RepID=UPI003083865A
MASSSGTMKSSFTSVSILPDNSNQQDAIQIFKIDAKKRKMIFYEDQLELLKSAKFKDYKVCVISVTGSYRTGKSFLLNFFLHFLKKKCQSVEQEWMDVNDTLTSGFLWEKSSQGVTDGILICPEIFLTKTKEGEKIAIILMDTQGMSDHQTSYPECTKIFALSALISSVHIYNIQNKLDLEQLGVLQLFAGYGAMFSDSDKKPFQHLVILIRDWVNHEEYGFGFEGGENLLISTFKKHEKSNLSEIQKTIRDNFANVRCFLMPKPGSKVETREFKGGFNKIKEIFRDHVKTFVEDILTPENLVPKKIDNKFITVAELLGVINGYWRCINENDKLCIESIYMATTKISFEHLVNGKVEEYKKRLGSCTDRTQANNEKSEILKAFEKQREMKLGTEKLQDSFKKQLAQLLDALCKEFHRILNQEDVLGNEYIEHVKECTTLEEMEKIKDRILKKFQKSANIFNSLKEVQELSEQRLTGLLHKVYKDFHILFDHVNVLKMEYIQVVKERITLEQTSKVNETILEKFRDKTKNMDCNDQLRDRFKQRLTILLDTMYKNLHTLFDLMNQLIKEYSESVKECRTLIEGQEMMSRILAKFEEKSDNMDCENELRDHFKQRLNESLDKAYNDFCMLFNQVNQLIMEYSERVKEYKTLDQAKEAMKRILVTFEEENLNCEKKLRDHFKNSLNIQLDKVYNDFCKLFNHVIQLTEEYSNLVKECKTLEEAQERIKVLLVTFEVENLNRETNLRDHFKQLLNAPLDEVYRDFRILFNHVNELIKEYSERVKECKTLDEALTERQRISLIFDEKNSDCEKKLQAHFKNRLNEEFYKIYNDYHKVFTHANQLKDEYSNIIKGCKGSKEAHVEMQRILMKFQEENLNCETEIRDHFKKALNTPLEEIHNDFCLLSERVNRLIKEYFERVKECKTLEQAEAEMQGILVTFGEENLNCGKELRDHFKQRLNAEFNKIYNDYRKVFTHANQLKDEYSNIIKGCKGSKEAHVEMQRILMKFQEENLNCETEIRDHFKKALNTPLEEMHNDFCLLSEHVNQLIKEYFERVKECKTLEQAEVEMQGILVTFGEENLNCGKELRDHFKQRLNAQLDDVHKDFITLFNLLNQLIMEYSESVKEFRTLEEALAERLRILGIFDEKNLNCEKKLRDHFKNRLNAAFIKAYDDFRILFNHVNQLTQEYSNLVKECQTLEEAHEHIMMALVAFEEGHLNTERELKDHFKQQLNARLDKMFEDFSVLFKEAEELKKLYYESVKKYRTLGEAMDKQTEISKIFENRNLNCEKKLRNHFKKRLDGLLKEVYTDFSRPCVHFNRLNDEYCRDIQQCKSLEEADEKLKAIYVTFAQNTLNCEVELRDKFMEYLKKECLQIYNDNKTKIEMKRVDDVSNGIVFWGGNILAAIGGVTGGIVGGPVLGALMSGAGKSVGSALGATSRAIGKVVVKVKNYNNEAAEE